MKRSTFLLVSAILSFVFGAMMFFIPAFAGQSIGISPVPESLSLLRGMGGLIIGSALINFFLRKNSGKETLIALFITNIVTHVLGISADIIGLLDGVLELSKIAPVQITHLFVGVGSFVYLLKLKTSLT